MYYCYILQSLASRQYYIGSTGDYKERLTLHNSGLVKSTKHATPWKMIYYEEYKNNTDARARELQIKRWKSRKAIERLINKI